MTTCVCQNSGMYIMGANYTNVNYTSVNLTKKCAPSLIFVLFVLGIRKKR